MPRRLILGTLFALIFSSALIAYPAVAQQQRDEPNPFTVRVYACDHDPGDLAIGLMEDPAGCVRVDYAIINVQNAEGVRPFATCVTGMDDANPGECNLTITKGSELIVGIDTGSLPESVAGYVPRENPITAWAYSDFAGVVIVLLPPGTAPAPAPETAPVSTPAPTVVTESA